MNMSSGNGNEFDTHDRNIIATVDMFKILCSLIIRYWLPNRQKAVSMVSVCVTVWLYCKGWIFISFE